MEHIFGVVERNGVTVENLKTVGDAHSDLDGFIQTVREYPDCTVIDRFRVAEKYRYDEDAEGNCYDWYVISEHYRYIDKTPALSSLKEASEIAFVALAELAESQVADQTANELAMAELAEMMIGG